VPRQGDVVVLEAVGELVEDRGRSYRGLGLREPNLRGRSGQIHQPLTLHDPFRGWLLVEDAHRRTRIHRPGRGDEGLQVAGPSGRLRVLLDDRLPPGIDEVRRYLGIAAMAFVTPGSSGMKDPGGDHECEPHLDHSIQSHDFSSHGASRFDAHKRSFPPFPSRTGTDTRPTAQTTTASKHRHGTPSYLHSIHGNRRFCRRPG